MYYGGDGTSTLQTLSYTCSYCGQMGFSIALLLEHIRTSHGGTSGSSASEVVSHLMSLNTLTVLMFSPFWLAIITLMMGSKND